MVVADSQETTPLLGGEKLPIETYHGDPLTESMSMEKRTGFWPMKVLILMSDTGGGHRASADALNGAFKKLYKENVSVTITDLWVEVAGWPFSTYPWWYRFAARYPPLWMVAYLYAKFPPTRWFQQEMWQVMVHSKLKNYILENQPDVIVSVHPMVNNLTSKVLRRMRAMDKRTSPIFCTVVTDYGDAHPMWFNRDNEATYIPSEPVRQIALNLGMPNSSLRVYGLALREPFWEDKTDKFKKRKKLGLAMDGPIALLMGGGDGMGNMEEMAVSVAERCHEKLGPGGARLIIVCGRNQSMLSKLSKRQWPIEVICKGFLSNIDEWMEASDLLITKAGPGSIAEAFVKGLPLIIFSYLPGQETGNMKFVVDNDLGMYSPDPKKIGEVAAEWLGDPESLAEMRRRAKTFAMPNASIDIARDIGIVYGNTYPTLSSRVGLKEEIRKEILESWTRRLAIAIALVLLLVLIFYATKLIISLVSA